MRGKIKAVFTMVQGEGLDRGAFRRIGTAFVNRDDSLNVVLDALPLNGRLHVRSLELGSEVPVSRPDPSSAVERES